MNKTMFPIFVFPFLCTFFFLFCISTNKKREGKKFFFFVMKPQTAIISVSPEQLQDDLEYHRKLNCQSPPKELSKEKNKDEKNKDEKDQNAAKDQLKPKEEVADNVADKVPDKENKQTENEQEDEEGDEDKDEEETKILDDVKLLKTMSIPHFMMACRPISGGVICFSVAPETRSVYLLLGQERNGKWCDFGGHVESDESVLETAVREFCEESLCAFRLDNEKISDVGYMSHIKDILQNDRYFLRLEIAQFPRRHAHKYPLHTRVYFIKQIPWQPDAPEAFARARQMLREDVFPPALTQHPDMATIDRNEMRRRSFEKLTLAWWSVDRLRQVSRNDLKYRDQRFRRSFMPVLEILLKRLSA